MLAPKHQIDDPIALAELVRSGNRRALARALTLVENQAMAFEDFVDEIYPDVGRAWRIGLTGPPGAGKSTLSARLVELFAGEQKSVGYVGVDPSSPFSGGAVLGDRIRLNAEQYQHVFARSVASRGAQGGLSDQTEAVADVLDAAGFDILIIESIGVGQAELDIAETVDTVIVVLVPESGDEIQAMKAGLLEIADILCVNKADRAGADALYVALEHSVGMRGAPERRTPDVVKTIATELEKTSHLVEAANRHRTMLDETGQWERLRAARLRRRVEDVVRVQWTQTFWNESRIELLAQAVASIDASARKPYSLASRIIAGDESE